MSYGTSLALAHVSAASPVTGRLEAARRVVEGRFLEAGEVLAQAVDGVGKLISSLDNLTKTLDPATVEATAAELKTAAASLLTLPERHSGRRDVVARLARRGDDLAGCIEDMKRNLAYLRVFAINIKITAGGVAAAGTEFGLFAQEICDCIELGRTQLATFDRDLRTLSGELKTAFSHEQGLAERCNSLLPKVPDGLASSAEALTAHHVQVSRAAAEVGALARAVHKKVGAALAALQIGDITRQRIEHVQQGLEALDEVTGLAPEPRARLEAFIHGLMAAQLRAAGADFHRDVARIGTSMSGMAADASEILRLRDLAFGRADNGTGGFLGQLETHVAQAVDLVGEVERADTAAGQTGAAAAAAVGDLSAQIAGLQAIKTDVQQMALNTTLKCSRIGETGKPLAVIAVELRTQAGHLEITAHQALAALQGLAADAGGLGDGTGVETGAGQALSDAAARLRGANKSVEADLISLARQGETVVEALRRAATRLDFQREIGATLDEAADVLDDMAGDETPWTDDLIEVLGPLLARIAKTYTMAQERETQRQATQHLDLDAVIEAPAKAQADDDMLF
ncbi:hypothetical protein [Phenylobacterium aquaticum]|uniref:hypothetical protein n=1 Tax=Phenylobacterium aquaticum TaxID=1763816 RepID=UPI0026F277EB|nr:hypothetical protein [Phenylobacterium aquaticum]